MIRRPLLLLLLPLSLSSFAADKPPARVVTVPVTEQQIASSSRHSGVVDFDRISAVSGEISGRIVDQHMAEGDLIKKDTPLVTLNTDLILKDMDIKRKERAQTTADLDKVGRTLQRLEKLLKNNSASRQAYDDARYDYRSLQKKRETLDEQLSRFELQLQKSVIRAPFDGVVLEKLKEEGEWISPGTAVCRLASINDLRIKLAISENLIQFQQPGSEVNVLIPALNLETAGVIDGFVPVANLRSRSVTLKVAIPYQQGMVQNLSASVELPASLPRLLRMIPRDALVRLKDKDFVYAVEDGKAKLMPLEIVARTPTQVAVEKPPVMVGMQVVIDGNDRLRPDQVVTVIDGQ